MDFAELPSSDSATLATRDTLRGEGAIGMSGDIPRPSTDRNWNIDSNPLPPHMLSSEREEPGEAGRRPCGCVQLSGRGAACSGPAGEVCSVLGDKILCGHGLAHLGRCEQRYRRKGGRVSVSRSSLVQLTCLAAVLLVLAGSPADAAFQHYCEQKDVGGAEMCGECTQMALWNESATEASQAHHCLGCEWMFVTGGGKGELMGLFQRLNRSHDGKYMWFKGDAGAYLFWREDAQQWALGEPGDAGSSAGVAYAVFDNATSPALWTNRSWYQAVRPPATICNASLPNMTLVGNGSLCGNETQSVSDEATVWEEEARMWARCVATPNAYEPLVAEHAIWAFGYNFYGELGREEGKLSLAPNTRAELVPGLEDAVPEAIAAGCHHSLVVAQGVVYAWGSNSNGQLGQLRGAGFSSANPTPEAIPSSSLGGDNGARATQARAGGTFSLVETVGSSGKIQLWSFGANRYGQLGRATGAGQDSTNLQPGLVALAGDLRESAAGRHHALALTSEGLYSWGGNRFGQLGRETGSGTDAPNYFPTLVDAAMFDGETLAEVRAGRMHTVVRTLQGSVFCFGSNLRGQCGPAAGDRNQPGSDAPNPLATRLPSALFDGLPVVAIDAGQYHTLARTLDGRIWGFGRNFYGQLSASAGGVGLGMPIAVPACISCAASAFDLDRMPNGSVVSGGSDHTLLLYQDRRTVSRVIAVGSNMFGQLGNAAHAGGFSGEWVAASTSGFGCASASALDSLTGSCTAGGMEPIGVYAGCDASFVAVRRPVCPPGSSGTDRGLQPCSPCAAGTVQPAAGASGCEVCLQGTFAFLGSVACISCPSGTNTSGHRSGPGACQPICRPGEFGVEQELGSLGIGPCSACPRDYFSDAHAATVCTRCPALHGTAEEGADDPSACREYCEMGTTSLTGLKNQTSPGVFAPCDACPAGLHQPARRATACLGCGEGNFSVAGSPECVPCPPGSFSNSANASACTPCDFGSYQDEYGQTSCKLCSPELSTSQIGSNSLENCVPTIFQVWAAGNNLWGQLGSGHVSNATDEVNAVPLQVANDVGNPIHGLDNEDVEQVAGGYSHTLFVTTGVNVADAGTPAAPRVWAAGQNTYGQLGAEPLTERSCNFPDGPDLTCTRTPLPQSVPTEVPRSALGGRAVVTVGVGRHLSVVLTSDGRLYTFGYNLYGQLGRPEGSGTVQPNPTPRSVDQGVWGNLAVSDIAVGSYHVLALTVDGAIWAFGLNRFGQLGVGSNAGTWAANARPMQVSPAHFDNATVLAMSAGAGHSLVLTRKDNGPPRVWAFGSNAQGQLGIADQYGLWGGAVPTPRMVLTRLSGAVGAPVAIAAGGKHSLMLTDAGEVIGFGSNYYGQLAARSSITERTYKPFLLRSTIFGTGVPESLAAGADHSIVRTRDTDGQGVHALWLFGSNRYGQLARTENSGHWEFNSEPGRVDACSVLKPSVCEDYTVLQSSAGAGFTFIVTGSRVCPAGSAGPPPFGRPGHLGSCVPCSAGEFSPLAGSTACQTCPSGTFSEPGATACTRCPRMTFSETEGAGACEPCPNGTTMHADTIGSSNSSDCRGICGHGTFGTQVVNGVAVGDCQPCPLGFASADFGATACSRCPLGSFAASGSAACTPCPPETSTDPALPAGGPDSCARQCAPGSASTNGLEPCELCPQGSRSTLNGSTACAPCAPGSTTSAPGATTCLAICPEGSFGGSPGAQGLAPCLPCEGGSYSPTPGLAECLACSAGSYSNSFASECSPCPPGSVSDADSATACTPCAPGYSQGAGGLQTCDACPSGTFSGEAGAVACSPCAPGWTTRGATGQAACEQCPEGTEVQGNECAPCLPGYWALPGMPVCLACPRGTYASSSGAAECTPCQFGTTVDEASTSPNQCYGLLNSSIAFAPRKAGDATVATLRFLPQMRLQQGENVVLGLGGFSIDDVRPMLAGPQGAAFTAMWEEPIEAQPFEALRLTVAVSSLPRLAVVEIEVRSLSVCGRLCACE